jgi:hypothetical protein
MAIDINPGKSLRHATTVNSTGNWTPPPGTNLAFIAVHGATGGGGGGSYHARYSGGQPQSGNGGAGLIAGAWVQVTPGLAHAITIGAGGAGGAGTNNHSGSGSAGAAGGTTIFDNAITVTGTGGGAPTNFNNQTPGATGSAGSASGQTSLTALSPTGAIVRTATIATQTTGGIAGGVGANSSRYTFSAGGAGSSGQVHIYI